MKNELRSTSHALGESNLHLQITPAYRRAIFANPLVRELTVTYISEKARALRVHLTAIECGPDHLHLFVKNWKNHSIPKLASQLKGFSSYMMRKNHRELFKNQLWGEKFWSSGYFYRTVGAVNSETVKHYIEQGQKKHWENNEKEQTTLLSYA
ncbi:MAG: IS200/IS605 family transposase [Nanoarchaeota archaeon]